MRKVSVGFWVLFAKLAPAAWPLVLKFGEVLWSLAKSLFGVKAVGIAGSVGVYTYIFTWQMGLALVIFIGIHEYGHIWAMKRSGMAVKGMYFIPGFGAVAISEEMFKSARNEAYVALMGPLFGLAFFVMPMVWVYFRTGEQLWAAVAALTAFINMVNLLPINPLDGGRCLKALAYSENQLRSLLVVLAVSLITAIVAIMAGFSLLWIMVFIGVAELATLFGIDEKIRFFQRTALRIAAMAVGIFSLFAIPALFDAGRYGMCLWVSCVLLLILIIFFSDFNRMTVQQNMPKSRYPLLVLMEFCVGIVELYKLRAADVKPIENYEIMSSVSKRSYAILYLVLMAVHVFLIYYLAQVPGAEIAAELAQ